LSLVNFSAIPPDRFFELYFNELVKKRVSVTANYRFEVTFDDGVCGVVDLSDLVGIGIVIKMFFDDHNPPHFHAEYSGDVALFDIRNLSLAGTIQVCR
jgi:hypothetical protein